MSYLIVFPFFPTNAVHIFAARDYAKYEEKNNFTQILTLCVCGCNKTQNNAKRNTLAVKECTVIFASAEENVAKVKWKHTHAHTIRCVIQLTWNTLVVHRSSALFVCARKKTHDFCRTFDWIMTFPHFERHPEVCLIKWSLCGFHDSKMSWHRSTQ